eukprot:NODE_1387_length_882_cov_183.095364_g1341_i0.p1 GENE.NODE_1387_length_882_cov_183.095364_g1341_i0~~NODE_1387_length_882_cov_183.095364_g1341_i0.p1  ORF type:complete len:244 (-),score=59.40 NODE_1387_length_882_cov_183.095364_g1341_i0:74-805(-)
MPPKKGKKGAKKKVADVMTKKEWYDVVAPTSFTKRQFCKTFVNKTQGNKLASEGLKGRVFESSLGDLMDDDQPDYAHRKFYLKVDDVQGRSCVCQFYGMDMTRDKLCSLVKKWCTLIEATTDVKTTDGYVLRISAIAFTQKRPNQVKKSCFAQTSQVDRIRRRMFAKITETFGKVNLQEAVKKMQLEVVGKDIEKSASRIYPLRDCHIRRVKILKAPKFDVAKLMDAHGNDIPASREETGTAE